MTDQERIEVFFAGEPHAVVGASRDRSKYGNMVSRAFKQYDLPVFPVNPNADNVEGLKSYANLGSLPGPVHGVSVITPPHVTDSIIEQAGRLGIQNIWLQPRCGGRAQRPAGEATRNEYHRWRTNRSKSDDVI